MLSLQAMAGSEQGYQWLSSRQLDDGSLISHGDTTGPYASAFEAVRTYDFVLTGLTLDREAAKAFIDGAGDKSTDQIGRELGVAPKGEVSAHALVVELLSRQNKDGGFGSYQDYDSNVLDTATALTVLAGHQLGHQQAIGDALAYLAAQQEEGGVFRLNPDDQNHLATTALCAIALSRFVYTYPGAKGVASKSEAYLLGVMEEQLEALEDWQLAMSLLAAVPNTTDVVRYTELAENLRVRQSANGSWSDDVYSTALALRVLQLLDNIVVPERVGAALVKGRVLNAATGGPLAAALVTLKGTATSVRTDALGQYELEGVAAGGGALDVVATGYLPYTRTLDVFEGEVLRLDDVYLQRDIGTTVVSGSVRDVLTGKVIEGAQISSSGSEPVITDVAGQYQITLSPGDKTIGVDASNYRSAFADMALSLGDWVMYSPSLVPLSAEPAEQAPRITGRVVHATTGVPIAGVEVMAATAATITDELGEFVIDAPAGMQQVHVTAAGYRPYVQSWFIESRGNTDAGDIAIAPVGDVGQDAYVLSGSVHDARTGAPVAGARIEIPAQDIDIRADGLGQFFIDPIKASSSQIRVSAPGYSSHIRTVRYEAGGLLDYHIALDQADIGGIAVKSLTVSEEAFPAYTDVAVIGEIVNVSLSPRHVRPRLQIIAPDGRIVAAMSSGSGGVMEPPSLIMAPGEARGVTAAWFAGISPPGTYTVRLTVEDANSDQLILEAQREFVVRPTIAFEQAKLWAEQPYTYQGADVEQGIYLSMKNRSNQSTDVTVFLEMEAPDGNTVGVPGGVFAVEPDMSSLQLMVARFDFSPEQAGDYVVRGTIDGDPVQPLLISVAPATHIRVDQSTTPGFVAPGESHRINIRIRVEGAAE